MYFISYFHRVFENQISKNVAFQIFKISPPKKCQYCNYLLYCSNLYFEGKNIATLAHNVVKWDFLSDVQPLWFCLV